MIDVRRAIVSNWAYIAFVLIAVGYSLYFIRDGYNGAVDEGYLQSIGARILAGEKPYQDFFFLRTPLSIYLQAGMLALFGDAYTIVAARVFLLIQLTIATLILSLPIRRIVTSLELAILLLASFWTMSMLLVFPWYSYDALFFAVLALALFWFKRYLLVGVACLIAGLAKQNYMLLILFVAAIVSLSYWLERPIAIRDWIRDMLRLVGGFLAAATVYAVFLIIDGRLQLFIENVFLLPSQAAGLNMSRVFIQDLPVRLTTVAPMLVATVVCFYLWRTSRLLSAVTAIISAVLGVGLLKSTADGVGYVVLLMYITWVFVAIVGYRAKSGDQKLSQKLLAAFAVAIAIQYLSCWNYGGLIFGYMGAGVALPYAAVSLFSLANRKYKSFGYGLLLLVLMISAYHKYNYMYHEAHRSNLSVTYEHPKVQGIRSIPNLVNQLDFVLDNIEEHSAEGDWVFVYPAYSAVYYLTDRRNPSPIPWFYYLEYTTDMESYALLKVRERAPEVIIAPPEKRPVLLDELIEDKYEAVDQNPWLTVYRPTK